MKKFQKNIRSTFKLTIAITLLVLSSLALLLSCQNLQQKSLPISEVMSPNIVCILPDDMGYGYVNWFNKNSKILSLHLNQEQGDQTAYSVNNLNEDVNELEQQLGQYILNGRNREEKSTTKNIEFRGQVR